jgi:hypothetical protein
VPGVGPPAINLPYRRVAVGGGWGGGCHFRSSPRRGEIGMRQVLNLAGRLQAVRPIALKFSLGRFAQIANCSNSHTVQAGQGWAVGHRCARQTRRYVAAARSTAATW